jgi:hypothetical protein
MGVCPAASRIASNVFSSVIVPNRIAPKLITLTSRAAGPVPKVVVYRKVPTFAVRARSKSTLVMVLTPSGLVAAVDRAPIKVISL